jgi:Tfp pilus assembly protein PilF
LALRFLVLPVLTTKVRQTTLHSITDIMAAVAVDIMDMDKAEHSINRILPLCHPRCRVNNNYAFE